jgi:class 3 adenylate cyclase/predicted ATPase
MDIGGWLRSLGLERYEAAFRENEIDDAVLPNLTAEDLKDLGVSIVGHRRKLLDAIGTLRIGETKLPSADDTTAPAAVSATSADRAERRQVTVMFSDLVGSTALSARMDPEDLREVISAYQKCVAQVVQRFGGFVAKYMGDGVLVYFGYPQAHEDDAERAVRAGLELVQAVVRLKSIPSLQSRVGIATGLVVVGDLIGSGAAQEQTVVGETPNLAARLQGLAEPNAVVIAESTRKLLGTLFELRDLGETQLKGIAEPARAWAALRPSAVASRFEALHAGGLTELVGRREELELLLERWSKAKAGEGQVVLLAGDAGIGKSRLAVALMARFAGEALTSLRYFCSPQHTDSAFFPIIGQIERSAGFADDDALDKKLGKLEAMLVQTSTSKQDAALFAEILSLQNDGRFPALEMSPQQRRQKTLEALVAQITVLSYQTPVLMILEDAHWADPTSLEVFGKIVDRLQALRVLLIVTHRLEFQPPWIGRPYVTSLTLNELAESEVTKLIDGIARNKPLSASVKRDIVERTDGIPLFVEEMTKAVLEAEDEGSLARTVTIAPSSSANIPATLHASLMARLDRLGPAKAIAQIGAVIGREFSEVLLAEVVGGPEDEMASALDNLVAAGLLLRRDTQPQTIYQFNHALVQDTAYQSVLKSRRQTLHANIAGVLEAKFSAAAKPELLAYHFTEAGRIERAIDCWLKAGQHAMQQSAHIEAERHLRAGLELLAALPQGAARHHCEIALQNALGVCLMPTRGFGNPEVAAAFTRAADISKQVDDPRGLFIALRGKGQYHMISGDMGTACADARHILQLAEEVGNPDFLIEAHHLGWSAFCFAGEFRAAQRHAEEGIAWYQRERDHHLTYTYSGHDPGMCARAFGSLSLGQLGYTERALAWCSDGLALAEALAHPFTLGIALWAAGILHQLRREPDAICRVGERMINHGNDTGLRMLVPFGKAFRGAAMAQHSEFAEGVAQMREGISELRSMGTLFSLSSLFADLADACARCGNIGEGFAAVEEGMAMMSTGGESFCLSEIHRIKGKLLLARSVREEDAAETAFREALSVARAQQARTLELRAATSVARLWRDQGKRGDARELLAPIYGWFTEGFDTRDLKEAKALLDELAA